MRQLSAVLLIALAGCFAACSAREATAPMSPAAQAGAASPTVSPDGAAPRETMAAPEAKSGEAAPAATPTREEEAADPVVALAEAEGALDRALGGPRRAEEDGKPGAPKKEEPLSE